jgi:hypothetical protein
MHNSRNMKNELPKARVVFPMISQNGWAWCIPAGLEVLLRYHGINKPTQEEMVLMYHQKHGANGYIDTNGRVGILINPTIENLKQVGFRVGNFDTFTAIANSLLPTDCAREFYHPADCNVNFLNYFKAAIDGQEGILGVIRNTDGNCHILSLIGYSIDPVTKQFDEVSAYDPATTKIETKKLSDFAFNNDCIIFKTKGA